MAEKILFSQKEWMGLYGDLSRIHKKVKGNSATKEKLREVLTCLERKIVSDEVYQRVIAPEEPPH